MLSRTGWPAALIDVMFATLGMLGAYAFRFTPDQVSHFLGAAKVAVAVTVMLQVLLGASLRLYAVRGQQLWPVRLACAAAGGAGLTAAAVSVSGVLDGYSREAAATQVLLFAFGAAAWRALAGLLIRNQLRHAETQKGDDLPMVEIGRDLRSMSGGVLRTWQYRHLLGNLIAKELKLKYQGSTLGFLWSLLNPLIMIGVYAFAFTYVMKSPTPRFVLFVLVGLLAWNFFTGAVQGASESVIANAALQKSVGFPRSILPIASILFNLTLYVLTLLILLPVILFAYHEPPAARMLLFPVFLALQVLFITGVALLLTTASTFFRDVKHLIEVGISIIFWLTPVVYEARMMSERVQRLALLSPMTSFIRAYQDIFYYGVAPNAAVWTAAIAYAVGAFACGLSVFVAYEDQFAEYV